MWKWMNVILLVGLVAAYGQQDVPYQDMQAAFYNPFGTAESEQEFKPLDIFSGIKSKFFPQTKAKPSYARSGEYGTDFSDQNPFPGYGSQNARPSYSGVKSGVKTKSKWSGVKTKPGSYYPDMGFHSNEQRESMESCSSPAPTITNSNIDCQNNLCKVTCLNGYQFPSGETKIQLICVNNEWRNKEPVYSETKSCEPICMPFCENNGICIGPGICQCPENYFGSRCQDRKQLCLSKPRIPKNSKVSCNSGSCTIKCAKGFKFPDGTSITNLKCLEGQWVPTRQDIDHVPDCQPTCEPPCGNGGSCLSYNVCQCLSKFRGPQCQYDVDRCSPKKMGFNGGYNCSGTSDQISCQLDCPNNVEFEYKPASLYTCEYSKGFFEPREIPQCVFAEGMKVVPVDETYKTGSKYHYDTQEPDENGSWEKIITKTIVRIKKKKSRKGPEYGSDPYEVPDTHPLYISNALNLDMRTPTAELCSTWGGKHVKTFDGLLYKAPLYCGHTLVKDYLDGTFNIVLRSCPYGSQPGCPHSLLVFLQNIVYKFQNEDGIIALYTPKKRLPIPVQLMGMKVVPIAQMLKIDLEAIGLVIHWDGRQYVTVEAGAGLWNRTSGLCGTLDMKYQNDFMSKDGTILTTPKSFVDSWKVKSDDDPDSCLMDVKEELSSDRECTTEMEQKASEICNELLSNEKLQSCFKEFDKSVLIEACIEDYCNCNDTENPKSCNCDAMSVLAKDCQFKGVRLDRGWRNLNICPMKCNKGRVYLPCGPSTEATCGSAVVPGITEACNEGCFCPEGTVQHNSNCIPVELCPCRLRNKEFKAGSKIQKDCNTCTCQSGMWNCTDSSCGARCGAIGDPHYVTFDGKRYDFMGKCSYYLMKTANFSIEAENVACPGSISEAMNFAPSTSIDMPSCTKSVTIKLEVDGRELAIKLHQGRLVYVNDKEVTKYPKNIGNGLLILRQPSSTMLSVDFADGIRVWWDGMTRVYIDAPTSYRDKTQGLCGTFNSNIQDDFLTPEGDVESSVEPFADKWRTKDTCDFITDTPSQPHPCQTNFENKEKAEKYCARLTDELFESCHWSVAPEPFYEDCMFDVCACRGDPVSCFCPILASYGAECSRQGINTNWRYGVKECAVQCPVGQTYDECGNSCIRTCEDMATKDICKGHCVEGCRCPPGQYLNDKNECIPENLCPCLFDGISFEIGYKEVRPGRQFLELCTCRAGLWDCEVASSKDKDLYPPSSEMKSKCANKPFAEFLQCLPAEPKTCKNMHKYNEDFEDCKPGCACMLGYVLDTSAHKCVLPQDCSCHHGGRSYNDGDEIKEECSNCKCKSGNWDCTPEKCASTCSVWGDSHFTTYDKKEFDFQGACDYVLSKGMLQGGDGFSITIQNVLCGTMGVTCSKSMKIALTGQLTDTITLSSDTTDKSALAKYKKATSIGPNGFAVYSAGIFTVIEVTGLGLQIKWDHGTRVYVKLGDQWKGKVTGLCGNYNGDAQDDMKTPSQGLETSSLLFGHSWKLQEFCAMPTEQIEACAEHPERKTWAHMKCGVLKSEVFQACHSEVPLEKYLKRCIFDTCACDKGGDCECLCTAIAAYAQECAIKGVSITWRTPELCPMQCDAHCSGYSSCVPACPLETCDNYLEQDMMQRMCLSETCVEGCSIKPCKDGHIYLNDSYTECVPKAKCKPICLEKNGKVYYEGDIIYSDECQTCRCSRKKEICSGAPCSYTTKTPHSTTEQPQLAEEVQCTEGWTEWSNVDTAPMSGKRKKRSLSVLKENDVEPIPKLLGLLSMFGVGSCPVEYMAKIECRVVGTHETPEQTKDNAYCTLKKGLICVGLCNDYEIRVYCQCQQTTTTDYEFIETTTSASLCDPSNPYVEFPDDCYKFQHCEQQPDGSWDYEEKTCGPSMMFNPATRTCDWKISVQEVKPICKSAITELSTTTPSTHFPLKVQGTTLAPIKRCDPEIPHVEFPGDCLKFLHCQPKSDGSWDYAEKTCGPSMMFNPKSMTCDWPANVLLVKPDCGTIEVESSTKSSECAPGKKWSDCATPCGKACHYYEKKLYDKQMCKVYSSPCEKGCIDENLPTSCPEDKLWRDKKSCVEISDCPCMSNSGKFVKPNDIFKESECEICQCLDNSYVCSKSDCIKEEQVYTTPSIEEIEIVTPKTEKPLIVPTVVTPPKKCETQNLVYVINGDSKLPDSAFSASSQLGSSFLPQFAKLNAKPSDISSGSWSPVINDQMQFLQISFAQPTPLFGVIIQGSPLFDQYVTSFKILYSFDGEAFHYLNDETETPQLFSGPIDPHTPVESMFKIPIESKIVRIYPLKWHGGISIRVELLGCSLEKPETPKPPTGTTPFGYVEASTEPTPITPKPEKIVQDEDVVPLCDEPMGIDNEKMSPKQVKASSTKPTAKGKTPPLLALLKLSSHEGWRPALDSPNEYLWFDFFEPRNITGLKTKGGNHGWVTAYNIFYSKNGYTWNKMITPDDGLPKLYLANNDGETPKTNYFSFPIQAQYLKVAPIKWENCIEMKIEPLGCFTPYPIEEEEVVSQVTVAPIESIKECPICPGIDTLSNLPDGSSCKCEPPMFWNGKDCVDRSQCPCMVGHMPYEIGAQYESEDCMQCVCVLGGVPQCKPQKCPPCKAGLRHVKSTNCMCLCEPCPEFQRLCPSSGDCIPENLWCNGIQDCQDDELDCEFELEAEHTTTATKFEETFNISKSCPDPYCPPGMQLQAKETRIERKMSPMFESSAKTATKSRKPTGKFEQISKSSRKASLMKAKKQALKKGPNFKKMKFPSPKNKAEAPVEDECFEFVCVPVTRPIISKNQTQIIKCPEPECPADYDIQIEFALAAKPNECARYSCVPRPQKDAICLVSGRSFKTFDSTEYKYDICSHVLARDLIADKWSITLNKNCAEGNFVCRKQLVIKDKEADYILILQPDLTVKLNGFPYTVRQLEKSPYTRSAFVISQPGNTILFVSKAHGFWLSYDKNGDIKVGVSSKFIKTVDGLCGFYNDIADDDKRLPSGKPAQSTVEFGDAWFTGEIQQDSCKPQACAKELQEAAWEMCNAIKDTTFNPCTGAVDRDRFISKCMETACDCLKSSDESRYQAKKKCKCSILENFVKECLAAKPELEIATWRAIHSCEISCPTPLVYRDCYKRRCEPSCENLKAESCPPIPNVCFSGCYCPEGMVRKGETCVSVTDCMDCACDGFGKSKYVTYDRQNFTFEGNCTYLLSRDLSIPGVHTFQVYVTLGDCETSPQKPAKKTKTKLKQRIQHGGRSSCATALHIIHGEHIVHIQRAPKKKLDVLVDGIGTDKLPFKNDWLHVKEEPGREILVSLVDSMVDISSAFADMSFSIRVPSVKYGSKMEGLCGDCNGDPNNDLQVNPKTDKLTTPDTSLKDIVESWQADEPKLGLDKNLVCISDEKPLNECMPLPPEVDPCMKIWDEELFGQCHLLVDPMMYLSACQDDLCKPGSDQKGACETLAAYAKDCARHGVCLDWRKPSLCPFDCPSNLHYDPCGCAETCETIKTKQIFDVINMKTKSVIKGKKAEKTCTGEKIEGCFCPPGKVLNNDQCIPEERCTQCDDGHYASDTWMADKCTNCECNKDGKTVCTKQECPVKEKICEEDSSPLEISKPEDCCPKFICVPRPTMPTPTTCPEALVPSCGSDQLKKLKTGPDNCPQYICECKPLSDCDALKPSRELKPGEKIVTDTLGCCPTQKIECDKSLCPKKPEHCEQKFYEIIESNEDENCCTEFKCEPPKNACLVTIDDVPSLKRFGDKWPVKDQPCTQKVCSYGPEGKLIVLDQVEVCDLNCGRGFTYTVEPGKCCGKCVQSMCNDVEVSYKPGEVWYSADNCTTFSCKVQDDNFYIVSSEETCPDISECPMDQRYPKGCCTHCKLKPDSQKNCLPDSMAENETIGIIQIYQDGHGLCTNKEPIRGFTECHGSCSSGSKYNSITFGQDSFCQCCSPEKYEPVKVPLKCNDGHTLMKEVQIPSSCSCSKNCGGNSNEVDAEYVAAKKTGTKTGVKSGIKTGVKG